MEKSNGNGELTKFLRWAASITGILAVFTTLIWYVFDAKLAPISETLTRYNHHFIAIHEWQKEKGEKIATLEANGINLEKRVDRVVVLP